MSVNQQDEHSICTNPTDSSYPGHSFKYTSKSLKYWYLENELSIFQVHWYLENEKSSFPKQDEQR